MKNLCFTMYQFQVGGCEQVFLQTSRSLENEILLATVIPSYNEELIGSLPKNVTLLNHRNIAILKYLSWLLKLPGGNILYSFLSMWIIPHYLRRIHHKKDIQYVNFSDTLSSLYIAVKASVSTKAISWIQCRPSALRNSKSYKKYISLLKQCKELVFICYDQKKELQDNEDISPAHCTVIYNPIDRKAIVEKSLYPVNYNKAYICLVSRLDERSKDFKTPIAAYSKLPDSIRNSTDLLIIGDGPDKEKVKGYIDELSLNNHVKLIGADTNPYRWMKNSDLFLFSSKNEGLGLVILEALACGKYVIATDCPVGPGEILESSNKCGSLVKVGDTDGFTELIIRYYNNPHSIDPLLSNASIRLEDFSIETFKKKLYNLFNKF